MTAPRLVTLTLGPPLLIGALYVVCLPASRHERQAIASRITEIESRSARARSTARDGLTAACRHAANEIVRRLPENCRAIVRAPFVLAGDQSVTELERLHGDAVAPLSEALWRAFFDKRPDQPVIIVALAGEESYRAVAAELDGYDPSAYAGYTQRGQRRIVLNLATGQGTLAHELCHLLALVDFPEMPEWFDEGLAALHEQTDFSDDNLLLIGRSNWRSRIVRDALAHGGLPPLETVIRSPSFRGEGEGLNYALVRGFCEYLQARGVLSHFYRKFRADSADDPTGIATLCELLGSPDVTDVDRDFRAWLASQQGM